MIKKSYMPRYRVSHESPFKKMKRSIRNFLLGLLLASVYGMMTLFVQNHGLWYSVISTLVVAALAAFGMGLSKGIRANVMLMLPTLCSKKGKNILLFLAFSMVVQGPMSNTMENFDHAASSVACGAELAINQTQELMERAATPLLPVLSKVKEVARNAYSLAGRVQSLIMALTESVQHIARSLRNVLHFLAGIGDVCNDKLGTPYKRCNQLFDEAREDCRDQLSVFSFLCYIVDGFRPLCHLAKGSLYGLALFIVVAGSYVKRLRRLICASYHPKRERERIHALHRRILIQRLSLQKNLLRFVAKNKEDEPSSSFLKALALFLPGGSRVARFLGAFDQSCLACGKVLVDNDDLHTCSTPQCKGLYCLQCFKSMDNICALCMGPLTFQEDSEEELDSSDDQQVSLWTSALTSPHISQRRDRRRLMKRRISVAKRRRTVTGQHRSTGPEDKADNSDSPVVFDSDSDTSEPDMSYQYPESIKHNTKSLLNMSSVKALETQQRDNDSLPAIPQSVNSRHSEEIHLDTVVVQSSTSQ